MPPKTTATHPIPTPAVIAILDAVHVDPSSVGASGNGTKDFVDEKRKLLL
jgi:hypothetical protein